MEAHLKVTKETINGKLCTVIWHSPEPRQGCLDDVLWGYNGVGEIYSNYYGHEHIATALPALTRNPTPEDAPLLYRYASEGIEVQYGYTDHTGEHCLLAADNGGYAALDWVLGKQYKVGFEKAVDKDDNRIDVAILDGGE